MEYFSLCFDVKREIYFKAKCLCQSNSFDLIIVTGEPFILFKYGHKLSKQFGIPWIADYRDVWTTLPFQSNSRKFVNKYIFRHLEKKYLQNVSLITTAAPSYKENLTKLFKVNLLLFT